MIQRRVVLFDRWSHLLDKLVCFYGQREQRLSQRKIHQGETTGLKFDKSKWVSFIFLLICSLKHQPWVSQSAMFCFVKWILFKFTISVYIIINKQNNLFSIFLITIITTRFGDSNISFGGPVLLCAGSKQSGSKLVLKKSRQWAEGSGVDLWAFG